MTAEPQQEMEVEYQLIMALQNHFLKAIGCYRLNLNSNIVMAELSQDDCGKPKEIDYKSWMKAQELAKKLFKLSEIK